MTRATLLGRCFTFNDFLLRLLFLDEEKLATRPFARPLNVTEIRNGSLLESFDTLLDHLHPVLVLGRLC